MNALMVDLCGCCGKALMEVAHPIQTVGTILLGLLAWLIYEVNEATK